MKKAICILIGSFLIAGCCTSRPEPGVYFYTVDRKAEWNTMYNQDGIPISLNYENEDHWEQKENMDHHPIVDGDDIFYMGEKVK